MVDFPRDHALLFHKLFVLILISSTEATKVEEVRTYLLYGVLILKCLYDYISVYIACIGLLFISCGIYCVMFIQSD
jgi:hypothetical protein